jgi:hypothetical protein
MDDIVQRVVITAEDQASQTVQSAAARMQQSFAQLQQAANAAGVSVDDFGRLSEKTQAQYYKLAQQVADGSKTIGAEAARAASGAAQLGDAMSNAGKKIELTHGQLRTLSMALRELGLGPLAGLTHLIGGVTLGFGAMAAGVVGVAAAGAALIKFGFDAAKTAEELERLSAVTGQDFESLSALQVAFAQSGVSAEQFAKEYGNLAAKVAEAGRTMADDIAQSAMKSQQATQSVAAAELNLIQAQLNARKQLYGEVDKDAEKRLADARARLAVQEAELKLVEARHAQAVAEANDLQKNITLWEKKAQGQQVAFNALTTTATKEKALWDALFKAGDDYEFVLADILKNASDLERVQIAKMLDLSPASLDRLKQGGDALRQAAENAKQLGLNLTEVDKENLSELRKAWNDLTGTIGAALEKLGALFSPAVTAVIKALSEQIKLLITDIQGFATDIEHAYEGLKIIVAGIDAFAQQVDAFFKSIEDAAVAAGKAVYDAITGAFDSILAPIKSVIDTITGWLSSISSAISNVMSGLQGLQSDAGSGLPMARGGEVRGPSGTDVIPALLTAGEFVMSRRAVEHWGSGLLHSLNAMRLPGFASGGLVAPTLAMSPIPTGQRVLHLSIEGRSFTGMSVNEQTAVQLERFAVHSQLASTGSKQSWRR